jgi:hypothetical protein
MMNHYIIKFLVISLGVLLNAGVKALPDLQAKLALQGLNFYYSLFSITKICYQGVTFISI